MILNLLIPYLSNENMFSFEEAVATLSTAGTCDVVPPVIKRKDFDFDVFFGTLKKSALVAICEQQSSEIRSLVANYDLSLLIKYAGKIDYWRWWEFIFERIHEIKDADIPVLLNTVVDVQMVFPDNDAILNCIINIKTSAAALKAFNEIKSVEYKEMFFENTHFVNYLKNEATSSEVIDIALSVDTENTWKKVLEMGRIKVYLNKMMLIENAIKIAEKTKCETVESIVLNRTDMMTKNLVDYSNRTQSKLGWKLILVSEFWDAEKSIYVASRKEHQKNDIPNLVLSRPSVISYLNALNAENSIKLLKSCKCAVFTNYVLKRKDITFDVKKLLDMLAIHDSNQEVWTTVFERPEVNNYLDPMADDDLVVLAEKYDLYLFWKYVLLRIEIHRAIKIAISKKDSMLIKKVFDREDLDADPSELISLAKKIDTYDVWKKVLSLPKVKEYINRK